MAATALTITHDPCGRPTARLRSDCGWVREEHPDLFDVIWVDLDSALCTTPDGARAVLDLLDEYEAAAGP
jgi:hypothetical protein